MENQVYVLIMAGGLGKRMKSTLPKVLHPIAGIPMVVRVIQQALVLNPAKILLIVGQYRPIIQETVEKHLSYLEIERIEYVIQEEPLGTGHAIACARPYLLENLSNEEERRKTWGLILSGDVPMLQAETLREFVEGFPDVRLMTQNLEDPTGCGRIIYSDVEGGRRLKIVEEKDCTSEQRLVKRVNCGIYLFRSDLLCQYLPYLKNENAQNEYYLTDLPMIIQESLEDVNLKVWDLPKERAYEMMNINNPQQLQKANEIYLANNQQNLI